MRSHEVSNLQSTLSSGEPEKQYQMIGQVRKGHTDACAVAFKRSRFRLVDQLGVSLDGVVTKLGSEADRLKVAHFSQPRVGIAALLAQSTERFQGERLLVLTCHLDWKLSRADASLQQLHFFLNEVHAWLQSKSIDPLQIPVIFGGDFNAGIADPIPTYLATGRYQKDQWSTQRFANNPTPARHPCPAPIWLAPYTVPDPAALSMPLRDSKNTQVKFQSVAQYYPDLWVTQYQRTMQGVCDHLFYSSRSSGDFQVSRVLQMPTKDQIQTAGFLPNATWPSDHLPIAAEFIFQKK